MRKKILILGSQGMLGQEIFKILADYQPTGWDIKSGEIDITNYPETEKKIKNFAPEIVINATGYTAVDKAEEERELANKINGEAVGYLAKITADLDIPLIHFSTDYVFNGEKRDGYLEDDLPDPINAYGYSKLLGESLLQENTGKFYLLRISWLFGKYGKNFVKTIVQLAREKPFLKVVNDQIGLPTYTKDVAQRVRWFIENQPEFGIYHTPNDGLPGSWYDFAKEILKIKNIEKEIYPCTSEEFPRPAKRPHYSILVNSKLEPLRDWRDALRDYLTNDDIDL